MIVAPFAISGLQAFLELSPFYVEERCTTLVQPLTVDRVPELNIRGLPELVNRWSQLETCGCQFLLIS